MVEVPAPGGEPSRLSLIRDTYVRFQVPVREIGKFGVVGVAGAIVQFGLQNALYRRTGPTASVVIAACIATSVTFLGNRYWAFEHRKTANVRRETVLFFFFNLVGMLIQAAFVDAGHYGLHDTGRLSYNLAAVIGVVFATLFRLFCYRRFVFSQVPGPRPLRRSPATSQLGERLEFVADIGGHLARLSAVPMPDVRLSGGRAACRVPGSRGSGCALTGPSVPGEFVCRPPADLA